MIGSQSNVVVCQADVPNANRRIYPKGVLEKAVERARAGILFGTLDLEHKEPAFIAKNPRMDGDALVCDIEVLDTPPGRTLMAVMTATKKDEPPLVSFVTRGVGTVEDGVVTDFTLDGISVLPANPRCREATVEAPTNRPSSP